MPHLVAWTFCGRRPTRPERNPSPDPSRKGRGKKLMSSSSSLKCVNPVARQRGVRLPPVSVRRRGEVSKIPLSHLLQIVSWLLFSGSYPRGNLHLSIFLVDNHTS